MKREKNRGKIDSSIKGKDEFARFAEKHGQESKLHSRELEIEIKEKN